MPVFIDLQAVQAILSNRKNEAAAQFLWHHLQLDLATIGKALNRGPDQSSILLHHVITGLKKNRSKRKIHSSKRYVNPE